MNVEDPLEHMKCFVAITLIKLRLHLTLQKLKVYKARLVDIKW